MEKAKTGKTSLQKRSRKITAVAVVVSMILLAGGSLIHVLLQDILESTTDSRIRMAAAEYKSNLLRLVENDIQILQTLESFWEERDIVDEEELAGKGLPAFLVYDDGLYKVRVGAFLNMDNGANMERMVRAMGYPTVLVKERAMGLS